MDKILFSRFARSVHAEIGNDEVDIAQNYEELIRQISSMTYYFPADMVQEKGKNMLTKLFPSFLLPQYKILFSAPFPRFSAWMNAWVTHYATNWLMGNSTIFDLPLTLNGDVEEKLILKEQGLKIERCRFLESSGCISTCIGTCKIPTQRFFEEEMGLPVTLKPNVTDLSCIFEFGIKPLPLKMDRDLEPVVDISEGGLAQNAPTSGQTEPLQWLTKVFLNFSFGAPSTFCCMHIITESIMHIVHA
mgnify:CR=1 FL=1